jgi:CubicO group peptidase (beta-lactamase class C family)
MRALFLALFLAACASAPAPAPRLDATRAAQIDALLEQKRTELHLPGLAMLIVQDGEVIYSRTLGQRDIERDLPVTLDTVFPIGSATKSFTSMAAALAQDDDLLTLDEHPRRLLPYFRMRDPEADAQITLRDMLSHQTGLRSYADLAAEPNVLTREEYLRAAIGAEPAFPPRTRFQYSNAMITAAGEAAARAYGTTWETMIEREIFAPLGMRDSVPVVTGLASIPDHATGYVFDGERYIATPPPESLNAVGPAGSIASSANDMAHWLIMMADGGAYEGRRFVSESAFAELITPHLPINSRISYALGWGIYEWNGLTVVEHNGGSQGISALVSVIPERRTAFVFLANTSPNFMTRITNAGDLIYPILFGAPEAPTAPAQSARPEAPGAAEAETTDAPAPSIDVLLPRMVRAAGGASVLRRHTSLTIEGTKSYDHQGIAGPFSVVSRAPAAYAAEETWRAADREIGHVRVYFDGANGGQETTFGQDEINDEAANASWRRLYDFRPLLNLRERYPEITTAGGEIDGVPVYIITLSANGETAETLYVSRVTNRIVRQVIGASTSDFDDFRAVDGELLPHRITVNDALGKTTMIVTSARFNEPIADLAFQPHR